MDKLTQAFNFRHACKVFDETKKIPDEELKYILEAGQKSPSSFGMEPWHFVVISNNEQKEQLKSACYNQQQLTTCSHVVIVLYRKAIQFTMQSEYLRQATERSLSNNAASFELDAACQYFVNYCQNGLPEGVSVDNWSEMQCYLASANMMTAAAYHEIDSCAIGGFDNDKVMAILEKAKPQFNKNNFAVALCLTFGYRKNPQSAQIRWKTEQVVSFL